MVDNKVRFLMFRVSLLARNSNEFCNNQAYLNFEGSTRTKSSVSEYGRLKISAN